MLPAASSGEAVNRIATVIGYVAGTLTTVAYLAQVLRTLKHKSTKDISLSMYLMLCTGIGLWLVYGIFIHSWPVIIANAVTLGLSGSVLVMKIRFG
jgi:MtN3 and saliva related transmembrane protein